MSYEMIALLMFSTMMLMLLTGQGVFGAIGFVGAFAALFLWGDGGTVMPFSAAIKLMKWYPLLTLPMFIFMGYIMSESRIADDLYEMFHVWMGPVKGGLAIGTIFLMVVISAMNGLSVAGMAIGATIALPELLRRNYDKIMVTGVIQAGSSLGILVPPSVVLVLYGMIARQPVGQLWLAGALPGLLMASLFILYIWIRCTFQPNLGPPLSKQEREQIFKNHIQEFRPNSWKSFDYEKLSQLSESFSGAEIKQSIIEAMYHAFYEEREFTTNDICLALNELIPLAQLESTQTIKLQNWASSGRIRLASSNSIYI